MTDGKNLTPVATLHENVSGFFVKFADRHGQHMKCGMGCSQCCVGNLSVFPVEAQLIYEWFVSLSEEKKNTLRDDWTNNSAKAGALKPQSCSFLLANQTCGVYEVRPTLCRAQGLPMKVESGEQRSTGLQNEVQLSLCHLNFIDENTLPSPTEWLDLERLNTILSLAQRYVDKSTICEEIRELIDTKNERVELSRLRDLLLRK